MATMATVIQDLRARDLDPAYSQAPVLDVYGRISINPDTGESEKVDRQVRDCLAEVERRGARLGEVHRDDGVSAWDRRARRPGWQRLVERLESGAAAGVVCWHTDRLLRQPRDLETLIGMAERGLTVASCHGDYRLDSADDRFTLRVITAAAAKESDSTSRRQKRKAADRRAQGKPSGGPRWFGLPGAGASPEVVQAEREAIAWAVRAHLDGASLDDVAAEWNSRPMVNTRSGRPWEKRNLRKVLTHPRIAGLLAYQGKVVGRLADVEPIVSQEDWEAICAAFDSRRRGRPASGRYVLTGGHLVCGLCGQPMCGRARMMRSTGGTYVSRRYYTCAPQGDGCGRMTVVADGVEQAVKEMVVRVLSDPAHAQQMTRRSAALTEVENRLTAAQETATELARRLGEGLLDLDRYDAAMAPLDRRIEALTADRDALLGAGADQAEVRAVNAVEVEATWEAATTSERRSLVRAVAPRGIRVSPSRSSRAPVSDRLRVL